MNEKWITSTSPFIYWCYGAANVKWVPWFWKSSLNSIKINCDPVSDENLSKFHLPNSSIFPNLDWNISCLSITSYVECFSIPWIFWNFSVGINSWKIIRKCCVPCQTFCAVDVIMSIKPHLKGALGFSGFYTLPFCSWKKSGTMCRKVLDQF